MIVSFDDENGELIYGDEYSNDTTIDELVKESKRVNGYRKVKFISIIVK